MAVEDSTLTPGCYAFPSWEAANALASGFNNEVNARIHLADRVKLLAKQQALANVANPQIRLERCFISLIVPLMHILGEDRHDWARPLRVLDYGGSFAAYYEALRSFCPQLQLDWTVVETPSTCAMLAHLGDHALRWSPRVPPGESFDVCFISGTLNYLPDVAQTIADCQLVSRWLVPARIPIVEANDDHAYLQVVSSNPLAPTFAGRFLARPGLVAALEKHGEIRFFFEDVPAHALATKEVMPSYYTLGVRRRPV